MRKSRSAASWAVAARPHWIKTLWTVCEVWDISEENNDHPAYVAGFRVRGAARHGETKGSCPVRSGDLQRARRGAEGPARHASHDSEIWLHGGRGFGIVRTHSRRGPAITGQSRPPRDFHDGGLRTPRKSRGPRSSGSPHPRR